MSYENIVTIRLEKKFFYLEEVIEKNTRFKTNSASDRDMSVCAVIVAKYSSTNIKIKNEKRYNLNEGNKPLCPISLIKGPPCYKETPNLVR